MARTKGNGAENKPATAQRLQEGGSKRPVLGEMPAGEMNATAGSERSMIAARPGVDEPMPGVTDDTSMPRTTMAEGDPGVLTNMPGEAEAGADSARAAVSESVESASAEPSTIEVTGEWRLTFTISGIKRA